MKYRLKTPKKVEDTVLKTYKGIEDNVVGTYKKIENKFVETFLERVDNLSDPGDSSDIDEHIDPYDTECINQKCQN